MYAGVNCLGHHCPVTGGRLFGFCRNRAGFEEPPSGAGLERSLVNLSNPIKQQSLPLGPNWPQRGWRGNELAWRVSLKALRSE